MPWFSGLAILLELVQRLFDAYIAMIPKVDGDSTPLRSTAPSVCSRFCAGCGLPFGLDICESGLRGGCLSLFTA